MLRSINRKFILFGAAIMALCLMLGQTEQPSFAVGDAIPGQYIVMLNDNVKANDAASEMAKAHGLSVGHVYNSAVNGFSARIPEARLKMLENDPRVASITEDTVMSITDYTIDNGIAAAAQVTPEGILRINGDLSSTVAGNGSGTVDVDVAVIDTGVDIDHVDLNIAGGYNCSNGPSHRYNDGNGHGTHVAGTVGAIDNNTGVVGVAPGARIWGIRVLNNRGSGTRSDVICGIDWVTANADIIEVANMSLGGGGSDDGLSCAQTSDPYKVAICSAVNAGVTFVVAAGNSATNAATAVPAAYDQVITVSALADFDGEEGGNGSPTCRTDEDDTLANFSNYGADVDIIAPGVCINSTWNDGGYNSISGTSMASPHVAGAAALYKANNPNATPSQVQNALENAGNYNWDDSDDPDGIKEPLLDVGGF